MAKPFYQNSTLLKSVKPSDDLEKEEDDDQKIPKNDEVEEKIIGKGGLLF